MSEIIAPSVAARLRFFVTDPTTGVGVTGLTHSTFTTAGYATELNGVRSSTTSVTLTSTAVATAALATGQVIEYGLGQYGIDVPAVGTSGLIFAVVTVTGKEVRAVRNQIREAAELNTEYLFDDGFGRKAVNANVTHYQGTLQGNGDLPAKLDAIKDVTNKIDTGLVLDGVVWQFTVNMLEAAIAEVPKYGDIQRHAQEDYDVTSKTVDVTVTKVT